MVSLESFWRRLELAPDAAATLAEWRGACGEESLEAVRAVLTPLGELSPFVPSPVVNAPPMRVVRHRDGTVVAVCDEGRSPRLEIDADFAALYGVATRDLRIAVSRALGLRTSTTPAAPLPGVLRVGAWEPQPSTAFPVVLAAHPDERELAVLVRETVQSSDRPVLVLTPTPMAWSDELLGWIEQRGSTLVAACEVLIVEAGGAWHASEAWAETLDAFARRAGFTPQGGTQNKRPRRRRGDRVAKIEQIRRELVEEAQSRVNLVKFACERGQPPSLPKFLKLELARRAGCEAYDVSRAFEDDAGSDLAGLFNVMENPDGLLRWWANHRRLPPSCS